MAAKAWGSSQRAVEEIFFQNESVSLCLLINRRARTMRVIDFRAGPTSAKRLFVQTLAQREGVGKVYTLVERDEVQTWLKLGFTKEGSIPGFYKRSDAFILGFVVPPPGRPRAVAVAETEDVPMQSETRLRAAEAIGTATISPAQEAMERTIAMAKRGLRDASERHVASAKVLAISEADARRSVAAAQRTGRALTAFETFGRDVER
ncbi:MAG TPA: hypothetical protein VKU41_05380, partial [Polyangiaceae bacterium]|nr:hypothetical protein [Polyangiaceae bacterium]